MILSSAAASVPQESRHSWIIGTVQRSAGRQHRVMVSGGVPPFIEVMQMLLEGATTGERAQHRLQREAEAVEVLNDVAEVCVTVVEFAAGRELRLKKDLERRAD